MKDQHLTSLLAGYRSGIIARKLLIREISLFVYKYPYKTCRWREDICSEFFCYFYPRIEKMIESFEIRGIPFEAYLIKCLKLQLKTFAVQQKAGLISLYMQRNIIFWPFGERNYDLCSETELNYASEPEAVLLLRKRLENSFHLTEEGTITNKTLKKRVTMLILKNIFTLKEINYPFVSKMIGRDIGWLADCRLKLNTAAVEKSSRKKNISEKRNYYFCRLFRLHQMIIYETEDEEKQTIAYNIEQTKAKISRLNNILKSISTSPTHSEVAEIMNIPKGSVDSGLFYLKKYLENQQSR